MGVAANLRPPTSLGGLHHDEREISPPQAISSSGRGPARQQCLKKAAVALLQGTSRQRRATSGRERPAINLRQQRGSWSVRGKEPIPKSQERASKGLDPSLAAAIDERLFQRGLSQDQVARSNVSVTRHLDEHGELAVVEYPVVVGVSADRSVVVAVDHLILHQQVRLLDVQTREIELVHSGLEIHDDVVVDDCAVAEKRIRERVRTGAASQLIAAGLAIEPVVAVTTDERI